MAVYAGLKQVAIADRPARDHFYRAYATRPPLFIPRWEDCPLALKEKCRQESDRG